MSHNERLDSAISHVNDAQSSLYEAIHNLKLAIRLLDEMEEKNLSDTFFLSKGRLQTELENLKTWSYSISKRQGN